MENYEVMCKVGEGSFARVYKARQKDTNSIVALKVIGKHGRSKEEIICLRREFEIQRRLNHPNIIRMLDSFETHDQIVAVTDYAHEALYSKLGKDGYLNEEQACRIVCDLVSALYYLHSNRVLHRDLKPQNILLEADGTAKLCDFGFARSMTTGTHVLTSIKGTPLYMAPELIEESPYDHNADLWSLGCIAYELLVGSPPFQTTSIVRLVRLIQNEPVHCPDFLSPNSRSFLQGLLQKNPANRLTWPDLLYHPFVSGRVLIDPKISSSSGTMNVLAPLTCPLTVSQAFAKERQMKHLANRGTQKLFSLTARQIEEQTKRVALLEAMAAGVPLFRRHSDLPTYGAAQNCDGFRAISNPKETLGGGSTVSPVCSSVSAIVGSSATSTHRGIEISPSPGFASDASSQTDPAELASNKLGKLSLNSFPLANNSNDSRELVDVVTQAKSSTKVSVSTQKSFGGAGSVDPSVSKTGTKTSQKVDKLEPIQCDEWIVFLKQTIEEVMDGQVEELMQENFVGILVAPLRNPSASSQVVDFIACLLSLPFIVKNVTKEQLLEIKEVYLEVKVVPNLVYASNLLAREKLSTDTNKSTTYDVSLQPLRAVSSFSAHELQALDHIYLVLCKIMYESEEFLAQFCDATAMLNSVVVLRHFLLFGGRKVCIVTDLLAILGHVMRNLPENANLVEQIVLVPAQGDTIELIRLMNHQNPLVRSRACLLLSLLGRFSCRALQAAWNPSFKKELEKLNSDKAKIVRAASREAVRVLSALPFYNGGSQIR